MGKSTISMAMFKSYVSLPEGRLFNHPSRGNHPILQNEPYFFTFCLLQALLNNHSTIEHSLPKEPSYNRMNA